ncbi:MAG: class I SAM-dependent methyltransferase [Patescibacteria group bacterium]
MKKFIENKIRQIEDAHAFNPRWFGIFLNPFFITRRHLYRKFFEFSKTLKPGNSILDVGCGIKPYEQLFKGNEYTGIEVSESGHDRGAMDADLFFDGKNIPFPAEKFDIVIASEVFEHVEYLPELTKDIHRVLKPGGTLFLSMPFVWPEHEKPYDFQRFTSFGHQKLLKECGFEIKKIEHTTGIFGTCAQIMSDFLIDWTNSLLDRGGLSGLRYKLKFIGSRIIIAIVCAPIQIIGLVFDRIFSKKGITLDYIVTARKI